MNVTRTATIAVTVATLGAATLGVLELGAATADNAPRAVAAGVTPSQFTTPLQNPYFPLRPGTVFRYRGTDEGERLHERVLVTSKTKVIQGITTTVVRDVLRRSDGSLAEKTLDFYAPDNAGNVWYFGEKTATYDEHGHLDSREGSWQAGVKGAVAGTIMPADPRPTDAYRQEYFPGHAEDQAWIVQRNASTTVPYGTLHHVVRSFEWTRLEKNVLSLKLYAPGLGIVREKDMSGGSESFVLVSVTHLH
jgi:hypothetical protein